MKYKKLLWLFLIITLIFGSGITYSVFTSDLNAIGKKNIAKFIFNAQTLDEIELPISDIHPGVTKEYAFSVSNNSNSNISNVTLNYELTIKTYHFMPLEINLYSIENEVEELIMTCDEDSHLRGEDNKLICNAPVKEMSYNESVLDNYIIKVTFPSSYDEEEYSNLVDFIDIEINSLQKIGG